MIIVVSIYHHCSRRIRMAEVLVVDDSPFRRRLIPTVLADAHDVVAAAESGVEAVDLHEALDPDVVVMRWALPIRDGVAAAEEINSAGRETSVVLFGEAPEEERRHEAESVGVREFLVTPLRRGGLLEAIGRARNAPS
jgi:CheY-like chemotaxis protein